MNNPNPFVPKGSLLEQQSKRRSRLKLAVFCVLAVGVAGLAAMLIQGCKREQPADTTDNSTSTIDTNTVAAVDTNTPAIDTNSPVVTPPVVMTPPVVVPPVPPPFDEPLELPPPELLEQAPASAINAASPHCRVMVLKAATLSKDGP